jgi:hypothetical protein
MLVLMAVMHMRTRDLKIDDRDVFDLHIPFLRGMCADRGINVMQDRPGLIMALIEHELAGGSKEVIRQPARRAARASLMDFKCEKAFEIDGTFACKVHRKYAKSCSFVLEWEAEKEHEQVEEGEEKVTKDEARGGKAARGRRKMETEGEGVHELEKKQEGKRGRGNPNLGRGHPKKMKNDEAEGAEETAGQSPKSAINNRRLELCENSHFPAPVCSDELMLLPSGNGSRACVRACVRACMRPGMYATHVYFYTYFPHTPAVREARKKNVLKVLGVPP